MPDNYTDKISGNVIKQIFLIIIIVAFIALICTNLSLFLPSLLGALTLYIISRSFNIKLQESRGWKGPWAASLILLICLVTLILPLYFMGNIIVGKLSDTAEYTPKLYNFLGKGQDFFKDKLNIDILSKNNLDKAKAWIGSVTTSAVSGTINVVTIIASMFFILYFMLENPRKFEKALVDSIPLKRANINLIGEKFRRLVIANAVGIPVVALGQAIVGLVGYLIFGAPSPILLFVVTFIGSMLPVVGAAIVYVPVGLYILGEGDNFGGWGVLIYSMIAVGLTDNVLRFTLLKKLEDIHPLNTVFGIIMGLNLFGFMGLIFGPILVSFTGLLIRVYNNEYANTSKDLILESKVDEEAEIKQSTTLII